MPSHTPSEVRKNKEQSLFSKALSAISLKSRLKKKKIKVKKSGEKSLAEKINF